MSIYTHDQDQQVIRPGSSRKVRTGAESLYRGVLTSTSVFMAILVVLFVYSIVSSSIPGWKLAGFSLFTSENWNFTPIQGSFGALPLIAGTFFTTIFALLLAVPISIGTALAIVFFIPRRFQTFLSSLIELLAVVPSVVYGVWGLLVIDRWLNSSAQPWLINNWLPWSHGAWPFSGAPLGFGMMLGTIVLAVMILPTVTSITRDVLALVPRDLVEGGLSLGATKGQVLTRVVLPSARTGIIGAVVLGTGRALGETVAMAFLLGGVTSASPMPTNLLATGATLASEIANNFIDSIGQSGLIGVLCCLALILMVIVMAVNLTAQAVIRRGERKLL